MEVPLYNQEGKEIGKINLPERVFGVPWNADLVHQVVEAMRSNQRVPVAHTKGRGEVRGGGKKPWKQKGTGRARHGSIRSPIWIGGGVTHGPTRDKDYSRKINKKVRVKALAVVLSQKLREGEVVFVDSLSLSAPRTKEASGILKNLSSALGKKELAYKKGNRLLIATDKKDENVQKSFRNIPIAKVEEQRNLNALLALSFQNIIFAGYKHD